MRLPSFLPLSALAFAFAACSGATTVDIAAYDKSCAADADCTLVFTGSVCGCGCDEAAIRASELDRYQQDTTEMRASCSEMLTCVACEDVNKAVCQSGTCAAVPK
jgi:hypothetical protein